MQVHFRSMRVPYSKDAYVFHVLAAYTNPGKGIHFSQWFLGCRSPIILLILTLGISNAIKLKFGKTISALDNFFFFNLSFMCLGRLLQMIVMSVHIHFFDIQVKTMPF